VNTLWRPRLLHSDKRLARRRQHCRKGHKAFGAEDEMATFNFHARVAHERWTNLISQNIETCPSKFLETATEYVASVVGRRLARKCADHYLCRTVLGWNILIPGTHSIIRIVAKLDPIIIQIHTPTRDFGSELECMTSSKTHIRVHISGGGIYSDSTKTD